MRKEITAQGATIEEARAAAAVMLGVAEEDLTFQVLQEPQKKTWGLFGGSDAKVLAIYEKEESPKEAAVAYLKEILAALGVGDVTVTAEDQEKGCYISLEGEDLGFVIGRRGDTLDALQYLVSLVANRLSDDFYRVTIDIGNYREKRERSLTGLAKKTGNQVARTGRKISLEPMNPYERRIVHTAVQEIDGATSWSVGSEPNRYVIIGPTEDNPNRARRRGGRRDDRPRRDPNEYTKPTHEVRAFVPRSNPLPSADGATPPSRTESKAEESATLYGRIEL